MFYNVLASTRLYLRLGWEKRRLRQKPKRHSVSPCAAAPEGSRLWAAACLFGGGVGASFRRVFFTVAPVKVMPFMVLKLLQNFDSNFENRKRVTHLAASQCNETMKLKGLSCFLLTLTGQVVLKNGLSAAQVDVDGDQASLHKVLFACNKKTEAAAGARLSAEGACVSVN